MRIQATTGEGDAESPESASQPPEGPKPFVMWLTLLVAALLTVAACHVLATCLLVVICWIHPGSSYSLAAYGTYIILFSIPLSCSGVIVERLVSLGGGRSSMKAALVIFVGSLLLSANFVVRIWP